MKVKTSILTLVLLAPHGAPALSDHHDREMPTTGYLGSFTRDFERVSGKLLDLAGAIPAARYGWRPSGEVRSVSEALIHVAGANFFLSQLLGVPAPEGFGPDSEKTLTAREDVIKTLEESIAHVKLALDRSAGSDLDEEIDFFGGKRPRRDVFMVISGHGHEHLGQLIVYARSTGVVPPWSRAAEEPDEEVGEEGEGRE